MKKLLQYTGKILLFLLLLCGLCILTLLASAKEPMKGLLAELTRSTDYGAGYNQGASEIIPTIEKVQKEDAYTKLLIGDSVCFRLFSELQDLNTQYLIAGTNRGVTMSGQYILVEEFLKHHPQATDVYLSVIEDSLITDYETGYGYQYGVMPFAETDTLKLLDPETRKQMAHVYGGLFSKERIVWLIEDSPLNKKLYYNLLDKLNPTYSKLTFPDVTIRYLVKMKTLCEENGVQFHLLAEPLKDIEQRHEIEKTLRAEYEKTELADCFPDYFDQITYYPEERFSDNVHPVGTREELNEMIRAMQRKSGCMQDLVLE